MHERWGKDGRRYSKNTAFYRAINKYGWNNFEHLILMTNLTSLEANLYEGFYINILESLTSKNGYNVMSGGLRCGISSKGDLKDKKFGRLTVNGIAGRNKKGQVLWKCSCECGGTKDVSTYKLVFGKVKSCGCLHYESIIAKRPNRYEIFEDYVLGYTRNNECFCIDKDDYELVYNHSWHNSSFNGICTSDKQYKFLRLDYYILGLKNNKHLAKFSVDYLNGNHMDFRKQNIKIHVPYGVDENEYLEFVYNYTGDIIHWFPSNGKWTCIYNNKKNRKSFKSFYEAKKFEEKLFDESNDSSFYCNKIIKRRKRHEIRYQENVSDKK